MGIEKFYRHPRTSDMGQHSLPFFVTTIIIIIIIIIIIVIIIAIMIFSKINCTDSNKRVKRGWLISVSAHET